MEKSSVKLMQFFFCFLIGLFVLSCGNNDSISDSDFTNQDPVNSASTPLTKDSQPLYENDLLVAEWRGGKIYLSQIDMVIRKRVQYYIQSGKEDALVKKFIENERQKTLNTLVDNYLLLLEAQERNVTVTPAEQEQYLREFRGNFNTEEEYLEHLKKAGQTEEDLKKILSNVQLGPKCLEERMKEIQENMTEEVLKDYYQKNIDLFSPPARYEFNQVVILSGKKRSQEEAKELASKLRQEVKEKMDALETFKEKRKVIQNYAIQYSETPDKDYNYGFVIVYEHEMFHEKYEQAFFDELARVKPGELSNIVPFEDGYAFFLMKDTSASYVHSFDSEMVKKTLPKKFVKDKLEEWREQLKQKFNLKLYEENLKYKGESDIEPSKKERTPSFILPLRTPSKVN